MSQKSIVDVFTPACDLLQTARGPAVSLITALASKKVIGLYFSADWCGPCRAFTPRLVQFYNDLKARNADDFEIVFVSRDRSAASFVAYYSKMPWLAISYADNDVAAVLGDRYGVSGIPALVLLDANGVLATVKGRELVTGKPAAFPWGIAAVERAARALPPAAAKATCTPFATLPEI